MATKNKKKTISCCDEGTLPGSLIGCKVEAIVSVDEKGQMLLPKELREKAKIHTDDKFVLVSCNSDGKICCLTLLRAEDFSKSLKEMLGPMLKEITG